MNVIMGKVQNQIKKIKRDKDAELEKRFAYLPKEEREKLIHGTDFVKVPTEELKRLRIDSYPYLM